MMIRPTLNVLTLAALLALPAVALAHDVEAVGDRLDAAVEAGEITRQQADAMLRTLDRPERPDRVDRVDASPDRDARAGRPGRGERGGRDGAERLKAMMARLGVSDERAGELKKELAAAGVADDELGRTLGGVMRMAVAMQRRGDEFELRPQARDRLEAMGADVEAVRGIAETLSKEIDVPEERPDRPRRRGQRGE